MASDAREVLRVAEVYLREEGRGGTWGRGEGGI